MCVYRDELFLPVGRADGTLLHTAALHSRVDCIPLLLAAGVQPAAVNRAHHTALAYACEDSNTAAVQLLLEAGGWASDFGFYCMSSAVRAGSSEVLSC
jgi:ankyrin repeat protein